MSFTDTEKHWLWGCAAATAASRSDVNVAMPHLRGKWSPTNAILRTLEPSFMRQSFIPRAPRCYAHESARQPQMCRLSVKWEGAFSGSVDSVLRGGGFQGMRLYRSDAGWQEREKDIRADAVIVSMSPTKLSLGMVASPAEPAAVSPGKIIVPRIVIGGVILDQPAGGGIGAAKRGASSLRSRAARSEVIGPPASLAARRIRWRRAAGPCSESHTGP